MVEARGGGPRGVASAAGAAAEFVDDGRTGFLCRNDAELATGLVSARNLDRLLCRSSVVPAVLPAEGTGVGVQRARVRAIGHCTVGAADARRHRQVA
jgi:hypothetical protein